MNEQLEESEEDNNNRDKKLNNDYLKDNIIQKKNIRNNEDNQKGNETIQNNDNINTNNNKENSRNNSKNDIKLNQQKIKISQKFEDSQEIANNGVEVADDSPSNKIKILKKDKHGEVLSNISYEHLFKVSLIGDSGTGKTSIMIRFIDDFFTEDTKSTIGVDFKLVSLEMEKNVYIKMQIWDTCGSERFKSLTSSFIKTCSAFILVFDLTRENTFKNIDSWINIIKENTSPKFFILIGNKSDLVEKRAI